MILLVILLTIAAFVGAYWIAKHKIQPYYQTHFNYNIFAIKLLVTTAISWVLLVIGSDVLQHHGDLLSGMLLIIAGAGGLGYLIWQNLKATNTIFGIVGTGIQMAAAAYVMYVGLFLLMLAMVLGFVGVFVPRTRVVYVDWLGREYRGWNSGWRSGDSWASDQK